MPLSDEEKTRIWEEERERLKARKKLEGPSCLGKMFGVGFLSLVILVVLMGVFSSDDQKEKEMTEDTSLKPEQVVKPEKAPQAEKPPQQEKNRLKTDSNEINVGVLINQVISGENFEGREIIISGVALNATEAGLLNIGTQGGLSPILWTHLKSARMRSATRNVRFLLFLASTVARTT